MAATPLLKFIADCRYVALVLGTERKDWGRGCVEGFRALEHRHEYADSIVHIETAVETGAMFVEMLLPHSNPVLYIENSGKITRAHGEYTMLTVHLHDLLLQAAGVIEL